MQTENDTTKPEYAPQQETGEGCSEATCSALFVNAPPILEVRDYVTAHGYGVTARFDFTDVPAKYHGDMLLLIRLGGYHLARPASAAPKPQPPVKRWWHKFLPNNKDG
jgi:hypothetical protein